MLLHLQEVEAVESINQSIKFSFNEKNENLSDIEIGINKRGRVLKN